MNELFEIVFTIIAFSLLFLIGGLALLMPVRNLSAEIQKNALNGDDLSREIVKNARMLSHQYILTLSWTAVSSLYLHPILLPYWKTYNSEGTSTGLMMALLLIAGVFAVAQQTFKMKAIAKQFDFPIVNIRNYAISLAVGILFLCLLLYRPENAEAANYAFRALMAIIVPSLWFERFCQKWVLSAYSGLDEN